jgi:RNA polymerase primary sigma factor
MLAKITKLFREQRKLTQQLDRDPTVEELSEAMKIPPSKTRHLLKVARYPLSLDKPINDEGNAMLGDFIPNEESPDPDEITTRNLLSEHIHSLLGEIPPREAKVLRLRYGLKGGEIHSLKQVGDKLGVTRERIRQIEAQALRRLRHPKARRKLSGFANSG